MVEKRRLTPEEVHDIATTLRRILTHEGLERLVESESAWKELCDTQEALLDAYERAEKIRDDLIESFKRGDKIRDSLIEGLKKQIEHMDKGVNLLQALKEIDEKSRENLDGQILALEQAEMHTRAIQQTSDYYATEARSMLVYVLERNDRSLDWIRLWEALPQDQKDVYNHESRAWLGKQPTRADPELRKQMLPPPHKKEGDQV
jgi:HD superfamily phosphohydrolase